MLGKIVRLRIFKLLSRKYKYLQFPTTIQLGLICPVPGREREGEKEGERETEREGE